MNHINASSYRFLIMKFLRIIQAPFFVVFSRTIMRGHANVLIYYNIKQPIFMAPFAAILD